MNSKLKIDTRVRSLKNYLDEFEKGVFKIPSFQRDFLWSQDDIKQLFDSIKNNYPIGSILFWKPFENAEVWSDNSKIGPYRIITENNKEPIYILDGFQRLSSLFGCLVNPSRFDGNSLELDKDEWNKNFRLFYDLEEEQFIYLRSKSENLPFQVPVYVFMNSIDFRQYARKNFEGNLEEKSIELYYDRADKLGQIFNNYDIASVDINNATIEEAVEIFWRVNAKGMVISKDWIASALTNKDNFRLGTEIDNLLDELREFNFETLKRDIIFQCIQSSFGKLYFDFKIEELVKRSDFISVTKRTLLSVKVAVKFLFQELLVLNNKLLPYNAQLIFFTIFFNKYGGNELSETQKRSLKKWFWITSYSNYFTIYSLSNQRKSFERFCEFIENEKVDPVFNEKGTEKFSALEYPSKITMGSVRAKSLALFMINYSQGIYEVTGEGLGNIISLEPGSLFTMPHKDNQSENWVPIIGKIPESVNFFSLVVRRPKNYSILLEKENKGMFISENMVLSYNVNPDDINSILKERKDLIINAEKKFVESLGIEY
jgi:hypothetical protein